MNASTLAAPSVSVIIPTTCEDRRWATLLRAIASASTGQGVAVTVIVVVNGTRYDEAHYQALRQRADLTVVYQAEGSAPLAQRLGRSLVDTEFFAFLDDDDEYLPLALWQRCQPMCEDTGIDFVATNGYRSVDGVDCLVVDHPQAVNADPLATMAAENWLASCGGLFRSARVGAAYFDDPAPFLEWTYLGYRLGLDFRMQFVDVPTFRIHDTAASLSKSEAYRAAELDVLLRIGALPLSPRIARLIRRKIGRAYHDLSFQARQRGRMREAWQLHLKSLCLPAGWRYLAFSRKLLALPAGH